MSVCSMHRVVEQACDLCKATPEDIFGKEAWTQALKEAEASGLHSCRKCNFVFYKTTSMCPLCGAIWE